MTRKVSPIPFPIAAGVTPDFIASSGAAAATTSRRQDVSRLALPAVLFALMLLLATGTVLAQPEPLSCLGSGIQAYGVQDSSAEFFEIPGSLNFGSRCSPSPSEEINNICYRSADSLLYGVQLTMSGNDGVVSIDADCDVSSPLSLTGRLPDDLRFDAGDCLPDGSLMFINVAGDRDDFYVVDLASSTVSQLSTSAMTWDTGLVNDWAYNPIDGKLYGGDRSDGELAVVTLSPDPFSPTSATREDLTITGLPSSMSASEAYGGAWFNASLDRLFLHRNSGVVYEIDVSGPTVVTTYTDTTPSPNIPDSEHNDSAACRCDAAYFIQDEPDAEVYRCDPSTPSLSCSKVCGPITDRELNNAGFNKADGLIYALELTSSGNSGVVRMDPNASCSTIQSASSNPLPTGVRFDAGDVTPDGDTLYVNIAGNSPLYIVDLTAWPNPTASNKSITGDNGNVHDWAYNPADGKLYGGDTGGQMAVLTIGASTVTRADSSVTGLPSGTAYGGAWFNAEGNLVLHRNDGNVYEIDVSGPTIVSTTSARSSDRNEGAVCVQ